MKINNTILFLTALALVLAAVYLGTEPSRVALTRPEKMNVILILADTLRADHLGTYGYSKNTSPNIDRLAEHSFVFENTIAQGSWTKPSFGSLLTSKYPHEHGALESLWQPLITEAVTLPEVLLKNGYHTVAFQTNLCLNNKYHFDQGFLQYQELIKYDEKKYALVAKADEVVDKFISWINKRKKEPFFAYIHFMDCHLPYRAPLENRQLFESSYSGNLPADHIPIELEDSIRNNAARLTDEDKKHVIAMYDASIHFLDSQIGRLLSHLKSKGLLERSIIILLSDHGEEFFEHGGFGHGRSLYNEVIRTPFILRHPYLVPKNHRIHQTVRQIDIYPTLLSLLGLPAEENLVGLDITPIFTDPDIDLGLEAFSEKAHGYVSVQKNDQKLIRKVTDDDRSYEFYDLKSDPGEMLPLAVPKEVFDSYQSMLDRHEKTGSVRKNPEIGRPDEDDLLRLRSLGYLH